MAKHKTHTDWSLCPYTRLWCFGRKVGDISKCRLCDVEIKFKGENNMKMINGVQLDKEIAEGWTIQDFIDEIDDLVFDAFMGHSIYHTPKNHDELSNLIENLIPKHMFRSNVQIKSVVRDLTKIYSLKFALVED